MGESNLNMAGSSPAATPALMRGLPDDPVDWATEIIAVRAYPVSPMVLWWSWWADEHPGRGHDGHGAEAALDWLPELAHAFPAGNPPSAKTDAVPVGAFIKAANTDLYGQVVWKEGAHPALGPDAVPSFTSGADLLQLPDEWACPADVGDQWWDPAGRARIDHARSGALTPDFIDRAGNGRAPSVGWQRGGQSTDGQAVVWERLVVDWDRPYGANADRGERWHRARRAEGRRMDHRGHLFVRAVYIDDDAVVDDHTFTARWLTRRYQNAFTTDSRFATIDCTDRDQLEAVLLDQLACCGDLIAAAADQVGFTGFRDLVVPTDTLAAYRADPGTDNAARMLVHRPRSVPIVYRAVSPTLAQCFDDTSDDGPLTGTGWVTAHTAVHYEIVDKHLDVTGTAAEDRRAVVRLDDVWAGGSIWRASVPTFAVDADPLTPLGLGWLEHESPDIKDVTIPSGDPTTIEPPEWFEGITDDLTTDIDEGNSLIWWRFAVSKVDIGAGRLPVPDRASSRYDLPAALAESLIQRGQDSFIVVLDHAGVTLDAADAQQWTTMGTDPGTEGRVLFNWPVEILAGTFVTARWQLGGTRIDLTTEPLPEPGTVGDWQFGHEFSERVARYAQEGGGRQPVTVATLVVAAIRDRGDELDDGRRRLDLHRLFDLTIGPDGDVLSRFDVSMLRHVVRREAERLVTAGVLERDGLFYCWRLGPSRTARPRFRGFDDDLYGTGTGTENLSPRRHHVRAFLRQLPVGWRASEEARARWAAGLDAQFGMAGQPIPNGHTPVREYTSGSMIPGSLIDDIKRIRELLVPDAGHSAPEP